MTVQRNLIARIKDADLLRISSDGRFPDWLGLLGLALFHTEDAEQSDRLLTREWAGRLLELVPEGTAAALALAEMCESSERILSWHDLESVEKALLPSPRHS
jgi:hypothetical protein